MEWFWHHYLPDPAERRSSLASPLQFRTEDLRGSASALIVTAECDILRDEGEAYAAHLANAGVQVSALRALGTVHSYFLTDALAGSPPAQSTMRLLTAELRHALRTQLPPHLCD